MSFLQKKISTLGRQNNVVLFLLLLIASVSISLLSPVTSLADPGDGIPPAGMESIDSKSPEWRATSYWYYQALLECMDSGTWTNISLPDNAATGKWINGNSNGSVSGFYARNFIPGIGDNGKANCNEGNDQNNGVFQKAFNFWGIKPIDAACEAQLIKKADNSNCLVAGGNFTQGANYSDNGKSLGEYLRQKIYSGKTPSFNSSSGTHEVNYVFNLGTFLQACAVGSNPLTVNPGGNNTYQIKNKAGDTVWYIGNMSPDWGAEYMPNPNISKKCKDLVNDINTYSADYQRWLISYPDTKDSATPVGGISAACEENPNGPGCTDTTTCAIDGIGWIICPVVNFMAGIVDAAYTWVESLLEVPPLSTSTSMTGTDNGTYQSWSVMRNIANVAFVIAFLLIIFSQLTSAGISNYGIKKMLPRLIVAAILVNVSYWICVIAVDISNILGNSLYDLLKVGIGEGISFNNVAEASSTGAGWTGLAGWLIAGGVAAGGLALAGPSILIPALIAALLAIVTIFLVLSLRQALIIILIFVSPLAFVAYLLPNTESLFKKWRQLFQTLLLMYPIIALIFGASAVASKVIMKSNPGSMAVQVMGALVTVIPLALTPVIMKTAGGLLNRFGGIVNNPNKGPFDRMRRAGEAYRGYRKDVNKSNRLGRAGKLLEGDQKGLGGQYSRRRRALAAITSGGSTVAVNNAQKANFAKASASESAQEYFAKRALGQSAKLDEDDNVIKNGFAEKIAGRAGADGLRASAQSAVDKLESESVKNREILFRAKFDSRNLMGEAQKALTTAIGKNDTTSARAAQNILLGSGGAGLEALKSTLMSAEQSGSGIPNDVSSSLRKDINGAGLKGKDNALATWSYKNGKLSEFDTAASTYSSLSDKELVGQSAKNIANAVGSGAISSERAEKLLSSDNLGAEFTTEKRAHIQSLVSQPATSNVNVTQNSTVQSNTDVTQTTTTASPSNWGDSIAHNAGQTTAAISGIVGTVGDVTQAAGTTINQVTSTVGSVANTAGHASTDIGNATVRGAAAYGQLQAVPIIVEGSNTAASSLNTPSFTAPATPRPPLPRRDDPTNLGGF